GAIGVEVGQIVKSLIFAVDGEVVVAYVSGSNQLDERKLAALAGGRKSGRVDADTGRTATGYPIGGVPPFGHATALRVFVDVDLLAFDEVWAAAGTGNDVFPPARDGRVRASGRGVGGPRGGGFAPGGLGVGGHLVVSGTVQWPYPTFAGLGRAEMVRVVGPCRFTATLRDLGPYPGIVLDGRGPRHGELVEVLDARAWTVL